MPTSTNPSPSLRASLALALAVSGALAAAAAPGEKSNGGVPSSGILFNRDIRPILTENCFKCHGPDPGSRKAGLRLDTRDGMLGTTQKDGPVVSPGHLEKSALWKHISSTEKEVMMPPPDSRKVLKPEQREKLRAWIAAGAPWQPHWSFLAPEKAAEPAAKKSGWSKNPIDSFVLARLETRGLVPAPEADRRTLARRVSLDLTGLPPKPEVVEAFVHDTSTGAYERLVDTFLDSQQWGEHRSRYWLDAARYADTHGYHFDNYREMWPYRDWVIRAFNRNQAFDQFVVEQLAGDLLPNATDDQRIATGFHRCNMTTNEGGTIEEENLSNYANDRVTTTSWVFLGLTANCAACHDHKFDPISQRDFYSLAAFFRNTVQTGFDGNVKDSNPSVVVPQTDSDRARWKALPAEIELAKTQVELRRVNAGSAFDLWAAQAATTPPTSPINELGQVVHAPLNEGKDQPIHGKRAAQSVTFETLGTPEWSVAGKLGPAAVLKPGATFNLGDVADFGREQAFSFGAWVRVPAAGRFESILGRVDQALNYRGWDLFAHDRSFAVHLVNKWPDDALKVVTTGDALKPGEWQHVFVTYDGSGKAGGVKVFVNGAEAKTRAEVDQLHGDIHAATPLRVGQRSRDQVFNGGSVQDVRVFSRKLGAEEVRAIQTEGGVTALLSVDAAKRTPDQTRALFDFYLAHHDQNSLDLNQRVAALEVERDTIRDRSPVTHVQREKPSGLPTARMLARGQYDRPKDAVLADTFSALPPMPAGAPRNRLGLAKWLVAPENPLMARVTVNRFWQELFGIGLVKSAEDFGIMGEAPVNQELLDWLAVDFREHGWDVKQLFRQMVLSATYRQSPVTTPEKQEKDPQNRLLSRGPRFRMDGEMVRDYALAASGLLVSKIGGPSVKPYQPVGVWEPVAMPESNTKRYLADSGDALYRRSLYTFWKRVAPPASMDVFNAPNRETCTVRRERTDTPLQALVTMNDPQFIEAARHLAEDALKRSRGDTNQAIDDIARRLLVRSLTPAERSVVIDTFQSAARHYTDQSVEAARLISVGESRITSAFPEPTLAAMTLVANQLMNLDEVLNK